MKKGKTSPRAERKLGDNGRVTVNYPNLGTEKGIKNAMINCSYARRDGLSDRSKGLDQMVVDPLQ